MPKLRRLARPATFGQWLTHRPTRTRTYLRSSTLRQTAERIQTSVDETIVVTSANRIAQREKSEVADATAARVDNFADVEAPAMEEIEMMGRLREGSNISELAVGDAGAEQDEAVADMASESKQAPLRSYAAGIAPAAELAAQPACTAEQRETPETWLDCIKGLETDGMAELAGHERDQLLIAFPDFEMP